MTLQGLGGASRIASTRAAGRRTIVRDRGQLRLRSRRTLRPCPRSRPPLRLRSVPPPTRRRTPHADSAAGTGLGEFSQLFHQTRKAAPNPAVYGIRFSVTASGFFKLPSDMQDPPSIANPPVEIADSSSVFAGRHIDIFNHIPRSNLHCPCTRSRLLVCLRLAIETEFRVRSHKSN